MHHIAVILHQICFDLLYFVQQQNATDFSQTVYGRVVDFTNRRAIICKN